MPPSTPPSPVPAARVAICLRRSVATLMRRLRADPAARALAPAKWSVLAQLHRHGPMTPGELAARECVRMQTLTRLLAELDAAGLVARTVDGADARRRVLSLTRQGRTVLTAEVHRREASLRGAILDVLDVSEREALLAACGLVDRVADALDARRAASA